MDNFERKLAIGVLLSDYDSLVDKIIEQEVEIK